VNGDGKTNSGFQRTQTRTCHNPTKSTTAATTGHVARHAVAIGPRACCCSSSRASSPERSRSRERSDASMTAHLIPELVGDPRGDDRDLSGFDPPGPGDVDDELRGDAAGPARQQNDAIAEPH